jgi:hypothetical protein
MKKLLLVLFSVYSGLVHAQSGSMDENDHYRNQYEALESIQRHSVNAYQEALNTPAVLEKARALMLKGKKKVRAGQQKSAYFEEYTEAVKLAPMPEFLFIRGDLGVRLQLWDLLQTHPSSCMDPYQFAWNIQHILDTDFDLGLELVDTIGPPELQQAPFYITAKKEALCLAQVIEIYVNRQNSCVPAAPVYKCLRYAN